MAKKAIINKTKEPGEFNIPVFMKSLKSGKKQDIDFLDEEDLFLDDTPETPSEIPSEMPVEPRISPKQADIHDVTMENSTEEDKEVVAPLTEAEKNALREYIHGMDRRQMEVALEEIPMDLIISHFSKKWTEAEIFQRKIAMAMGK